MKLPIQAQPVLRNDIQTNSLNQGVIPSACSSCIYADQTYSIGECIPDPTGRWRSICCYSYGWA